MKHITQGILSSALVSLLALTATNAQAQCTTWVNPTDSSGWSDFNSQFGGAPTPDGSGNCATNEITAFEVYADEAYAMNNIQQGVTYTWSACNGTGGTAWPLMFTIINPSGTVDAYGTNAGSNCALSWTASETGTYLIVVSEVGACGTSANAGTNNGYPSITCGGTIGMAELAGEASIEVFPNPSNGMITVTLEGMEGQGVLEVMEVSGRIALSTNLKAGETTKRLDLSDLSNGTYFVNLRQNGKVTREKFVLAR